MDENHSQNWIKSFHLNVDVEEAALGHLEHEAHLGSGVDPLVEALLRMGVDANEVAGRGGAQDGHQNHQLRHGEHGSGALAAGRREVICGVVRGGAGRFGGAAGVEPHRTATYGLRRWARRDKLKTARKRREATNHRD